MLQSGWSLLILEYVNNIKTPHDKVGRKAGVLIYTDAIFISHELNGMFNNGGLTVQFWLLSNVRSKDCSRGLVELKY